MPKRQKTRLEGLKDSKGRRVQSLKSFWFCYTGSMSRCSACKAATPVEILHVVCKRAGRGFDKRINNTRNTSQLMGRASHSPSSREQHSPDTTSVNNAQKHFVQYKSSGKHTLRHSSSQLQVSTRESSIYFTLANYRPASSHTGNQC